MRIITAIAAATVALATPALAQVSTVTADHNGSTMKVEVFSNGHTVISYVTPRPGLAEAGIIPGMIVFSGKYEAGHLTGKAYTFKAGCQPAAYDVGGGVSRDTFVLTGPGPQRRGCTVIGLSPASPHASLRFTIPAGAMDTLLTDASGPRTAKEMVTILAPAVPSPVVVAPEASAVAPMPALSLRPSTPESVPVETVAPKPATVAPVQRVEAPEPVRPAIPPVQMTVPVVEPRKVETPVLPAPTPSKPTPVQAEPVKVKKPALDADL